MHINIILNKYQIFDVIPIKDVTVKQVERSMIIPEGNPFGIKIITDGVKIIGITYYDPISCAFGGLGHPICDSDTGGILPIKFTISKIFSTSATMAIWKSPLV